MSDELTAGAPTHSSLVTRHRSLSLLLGVLALTVLLRGWAIDWGAPYLYHPDEHLILHPALNMVRECDPNPHWFQYPSLFFYLEAAVVMAVRPFVDASLVTDPAVNHVGPWDALPAQWPYALGGRLVVVGFAVLGVWLLYRAAASYTAPAAGLGAALFLVSSPLHNESSHFMTTDVPAATFLTAVLAVSLGAPRAPSTRRLAVAGVLAGLAAGTKYTAGIALFVPVAIALSAPWRDAARNLLIIAAAAAVGFVVACPYAVVDLPAFVRGLQQQRQNYLVDNAPGSDWRWYVRYLYGTGLLPPLSLACGVGLLATLLRGFLLGRAEDASRPPRHVHVALAVVPVAYFIFLSWYPYRAQRNLVVLLPFLCLAAADIGWRAARRLAAGRLATAGFALLVAGVAAPGVLACVRHDRELAQPDTRTVALQWIEANVPSGSRVAREEYTPQVPAARYAVTYVWSLAFRPYSQYVGERFDYLVVSANVYQRVLHPPYIAGPTGPPFYQTLFRTLPPEAEFAPNAERGGPLIRIYRVPHGG